jgi:hypothetical protein
MIMMDNYLLHREEQYLFVALVEADWFGEQPKVLRMLEALTQPLEYKELIQYLNDVLLLDLRIMGLQLCS